MVDLLSEMMNDSLSDSPGLMTAKKHGRKTKLAANYTPGKYAVLCGRGSKCTKSSGNQRLKQLVNSYLKPYSDAKNKVEKTSIVSTIIASVKQASPDGAFVKYEEGAWWEVEDAFAREKIGCLFRDCLHTQYRSSTKAKLARKKATVDPMSMSDHSSIANVGQSDMHSSLHSNMGSFVPMGGNSTHQRNNGSQPFSNLQDDSLFNGFQDNMIQPQNAPQQNLQQPMPFNNMGSTFPNKGNLFKNNEYAALLGNYLGSQPSRPHRDDFLRGCMQMPNRRDNPLSQNNNNMMGGGPRLNPAMSLFQEASEIIRENNDGFNRSNLGGDDFPDDISDIFNDDEYTGLHNSFTA